MSINNFLVVCSQSKHVFSLPSSSLDISDPIEYAKLKSGEIGQNIDIINVLPGAHSTLLHESIHFHNATNFKITFFDGSNRITLFPRNKGVVISHHQNMSFTIPNNYNEYEYSLESQSILGEDEVDFLATLTQATSFTVQDMGDTMIRFKHRILQWPNLKNLQFIRMTVSKRFLFGSLFNAYLRFMPALRTAVFVFAKMSSREIEKFVKNQGIPYGWKRHGSVKNVVAYHKEGNVEETEDFRILFFFLVI